VKHLRVRRASSAGRENTRPLSEEKKKSLGKGDQKETRREKCEDRKEKRNKKFLPTTQGPKKKERWAPRPENARKETGVDAQKNCHGCDKKEGGKASGPSKERRGKKRAAAGF